MAEEYYKTESSVQEYIELAKDVNGKELIEKLKPHLLKNSTVLELGSGPGTDWKILKQHYKTIGSDFSDEFLTHLKQQNPKEQFLKLDASTITTNIKFDGIYANKVMHHLSDEKLKASVKRQAEILNTNGTICLSFWEGKGSEVFKGMFVNYHDKESIKEYFEPFFHVLTLETYMEFEKDDSLLLIARKK